MLGDKLMTAKIYSLLSSNSVYQCRKFPQDTFWRFCENI